MPKPEENKTLNNKIRKLAPDAIEAMGDMLRDPHTPAPTKAQIIGFILERTLGKPDTTIHLTTAGGTLKDSENRLIAIAQEIKEEAEANQEYESGSQDKEENDKEVNYGEGSAEDDDEDDFEEEYGEDAEE